jgi:hypothetical protein
MDALKQRPGTEGDLFVRVQPRRRAPWALIAAILVLGMLSGGGVYLANYQPLSIGGMATSGDHANSNLHDIDNSVRTYRYVEGGRTYATVWIFNKGRWGVTLTGVDRPEPASAGLIAIADVRMADESAPLDPAASTPFRSFSLGHGEGQAVMLVLQFGHCEDFSVGTAETFVSLPVHFRILGISRMARLDLSEGIMVQAPSDANCSQRAIATR